MQVTFNMSTHYYIIYDFKKVLKHKNLLKYKQG